jgi:hypothetical protein
VPAVFTFLDGREKSKAAADGAREEPGPQPLTARGSR